MQGWTAEREGRRYLQAHRLPLFLVDTINSALVLFSDRKHYHCSSAILLGLNKTKQRGNGGESLEEREYSSVSNTVRAAK